MPDNIIEIVIFALVILYYIINSFVKKKQKSTDFEWEGDGVLDSIIREGEEKSNQSKKTSYDAEEMKDFQEYSVHDNGLKETEKTAPSSSQKSQVKETIQKIFTQNQQKNNSASNVKNTEDDFETGLRERSTFQSNSAILSNSENFEENLAARASGAIFSNDLFTTNIKKDKTNEPQLSCKTSRLENILSKYESHELLVVLPEIMKRPNF